MILNIKRLIQLFMLGIFLVVAGCQSVKRVNIKEMEFTGMDKADVVKLLGEPDQVEELVKNTEYIFGPIEGLWAQIEMGEKIVIWKYENGDGHKELYFFSDETEVVGEFYWYNDPEKNPVF
jgi:hypothetical protein